MDAFVQVRSTSLFGCDVFEDFVIAFFQMPGRTGYVR